MVWNKGNHVFSYAFNHPFPFAFTLGEPISSFPASIIFSAAYAIRCEETWPFSMSDDKSSICFENSCSCDPHAAILANGLRIIMPAPDASNVLPAVAMVCTMGSMELSFIVYHSSLNVHYIMDEDA